jgi:hypothetical protein
MPTLEEELIRAAREAAWRNAYGPAAGPMDIGGSPQKKYPNQLWLALMGAKHGWRPAPGRGGGGGEVGGKGETPSDVELKEAQTGESIARAEMSRKAQALGEERLRSEKLFGPSEWETPWAKRAGETGSELEKIRERTKGSLAEIGAKGTEDRTTLGYGEQLPSAVTKRDYIRAQIEALAKKGALEETKISELRQREMMKNIVQYLIAQQKGQIGGKQIISIQELQKALDALYGE